MTAPRKEWGSDVPCTLPRRDAGRGPRALRSRPWGAPPVAGMAGLWLGFLLEERARVGLSLGIWPGSPGDRAAGRGESGGEPPAAPDGAFTAGDGVGGSRAPDRAGGLPS